MSMHPYLQQLSDLAFLRKWIGRVSDVEIVSRREERLS